MDKVVLTAVDTVADVESGPSLAVGGALATALARTPDLVQRSGSLAAEVAAAVAGRSTIEPERGDRRFTDPAWSSHPVYRRLSQAYLAVERAIGTAVEDADIDCGLAGTVMRFVPPVAALSSASVAFDGDAHMRNRPVGEVLAEGTPTEIQRNPKVLEVYLKT